MKVEITGKFFNNKREIRYVALAETNSKKRTGIGSTKEAAMFAAKKAVIGLGSE